MNETKSPEKKQCNQSEDIKKSRRVASQGFFFVILTYVGGQGAQRIEGWLEEAPEKLARRGAEEPALPGFKIYFNVTSWIHSCME